MKLMSLGEEQDHKEHAQRQYNSETNNELVNLHGPSRHQISSLISPIFYLYPQSKCMSI